MRDVEQAYVVGPAVRLLSRFVDSFGNELLAVAQHLDLVDHVVWRLERGGNLLERRHAPEWDQPLGRQADTFEDRGAVLDHVDQSLLDLIRHVLVADIDIEARSVARADAGTERAGTCVCPRGDGVFGPDGYMHVLPAVERRPLAARQDRDRLIAELRQGHPPCRYGE